MDISSQGDNLNDPPKHSKALKRTAFILTGLIILIGVFALGMNVGFYKARFTDNWIKNYPANFANGTGVYPMPLPPPNGSFNNHGVLGTILSTDGKTVIIKDEADTEKTIVLSSDTAYRQDSKNLKAEDLKISQKIVVIGSPNEQGQIEAKFIRIVNK